VFWGLPATRLAGVPVVSLVYQNYEETAAKMAAARRLLRWPTRVIAGSNDVARFMHDELGVPTERLQTIYCGIAPEPFARIRAAATQTSQPTIVSVGRLVPRKGHRTLIDALPEIRRRHPQAELVIIGEGPCRAELEARVRQIGLAHAVRLPGTVYPTHAALADATVFVFPSLAEPQGLALLEAFAAGVPVVASRTGGITEMLEHEVDGLLVPPGDSGALAAAVCGLLDDQSRARGMAMHARARLAPFQVSTIADAYLHLYRETATVRRVATAAPVGPSVSAAYPEHRQP
jgi:glycosyltransferase involved in cell wall biosynthesis